MSHITVTRPTFSTMIDWENQNAKDRLESGKNLLPIYQAVTTQRLSVTELPLPINAAERYLNESLWTPFYCMF